MLRRVRTAIRNTIGRFSRRNTTSETKVGTSKTGQRYLKDNN